MKTAAIALFEISCHFRRATTWIYFAIFLTLAFMATASLVDDARTGEFFFNSPILIAGATVITSLLGLLVTAGIAGDAATRDVQTRMAPLVYATAIDKTSYVLGRFAGAFAVSALLLAAVPAGLVILTQLPALERELIGPTRLPAYLGAYLLIALPNAFVTTAILYSLATLTRRAMTAFAGAATLFLITLFTRELLADVLGRWELAKRIDPSAFTNVSAMWRSWSAVEKNVQLVPLDGALLTNRLLWIGIAVAMLMLARARFRFAHAVGGGRSSVAGGDAAIAPDEIVPLPTANRQPPTRSFSLPTRIRQTFSLALYSYRDLFATRAVLLLPLLAAGLVFIGAELMEIELGTPSLPTTARVLPLFGNIMVAVVIAVVTTLFAGELVWKERDARLASMTDVAPVPDWVTFLGKFLALGLMLVTVQAALLASGLVLQAAQGYFDFELGLYLRVLFGLRLADALLFAVIAMTVHVLVNQKYLGHVIASLVFLYGMFAGEIGVEHKLLIYGADPGFSYTDMNGFGASIGPWLWFKAYTAGWALLFAAVAKALWVRGTERRVRITRATIELGAAAIIVIAITGGVIFHNTNVRNTYRSVQEPKPAEIHARSPQPLLTATKLHVELHPRRHAFSVKGTYRLVNHTQRPMDAIHVVVSRDAETSVTGLGNATRVDGQHRLYRLARPLQPGQALPMQFDVRLEPRGFTNRGVRSPILDNGTNFDPKEWLPLVGYLSNEDETRSLYDVAARHDASDREAIDFEAVVGTDDDQYVVAPGTLRREWTTNGRRYFHYRTEAPIRNIYAFFSARYAMREVRHRGVTIQVFHHPEHAVNVDRMLRSAKASLDYYTRHFSPYPHPYLRIVEYARPGMLLRAYPGTIMYSEAFAVVNPSADGRDLDLPFAVMAHEIAHQWFGHQIVPAGVEGGPVLSESLAWYGAMMVVEETLGEDHLWRLLDMMRREYLTPRKKATVPLMRATNRFDGYRRGPFAMYALRDAAGEEKVNAALRSFLAEHGTARPPFPTALDLYAHLCRAAPREVVDDLFATNTFWDLEATGATVQPAPSGQWRVTLHVRARKTRADAEGKETAIPMDDLVDVGVYTDGVDAPIYLRKHRIRSGDQAVTVTVPRKPSWAGVDPKNVLIETERDNNLRKL